MAIGWHYIKTIVWDGEIKYVLQETAIDCSKQKRQSVSLQF